MDDYYNCFLGCTALMALYNEDQSFGSLFQIRDHSRDEEVVNVNRPVNTDEIDTFEAMA